MNTEKLVCLIEELLSDVKPTVTQSSTPQADSRRLVKKRSAAIARGSFLMSLAPEPVGLSTAIVDIVRVFKVQCQLWVDIATLYGQEVDYAVKAFLYATLMHGAGQGGKLTIWKVAEKGMKKKGLRFIQKELIAKLSIEIGKQSLKRGIATAAPIIGAAGVGGIVYWQCKKLGIAAIAQIESQCRFNL